MKASNRIIVNTLAQYIRTVINLVLSLYSSRLVLDILGVDDYGVYSLVAGVVSLLSFLNNSLVSSTQRFLSVSQGRGNVKRLQEVFSNSLILHTILGFVVILILFFLTPFIFNGFLNIPSDRVDVATKLYRYVVLMVYCSFLASPFKALLISHENIVYTSIVDVMDGVLKVVLVLLLPFFSFDKLLTYGFIMLGIQLFNLMSYMIYCYVKYEECILPKSRLFSYSYIKELSGFTSWMLYSSVCITIRTQGLSVVLNKIYGTAINAAYGIGCQLSGMVSFVSSSFNNAVAPQLMAAEGGGDRRKMLSLAEIQSKASFLLLAMIGIPTMFEMQTLLEIWLVDVPKHTMLFACVFLAMQIVDMLSVGLGAANQAIGNIRRYTLVTYTPKLLVLPLSWCILKYTDSLILVGIIMFLCETICMFLRIFLFRSEPWFDARGYCISVLLRSVAPVIASIIICCAVRLFMDSDLRIIFTYLCSVPMFIVVSYIITLTKLEKRAIKSILRIK